MAINRALMKRQMYNMGGPTLEAGAPDLRLTGDQNHRGTYTQRRRNQMAYGGIAGLDGRKAYGIGSFFQDVKDKFVDDIIPNEIKENPVAAALAGGALLNQFGIPFTGTAGDRMGQNWLGELLGKVPGVPEGLNLVIGDDRNLLGEYTGEFPDQIGDWTPGAGNVNDYIIGGGIGGTGVFDYEGDAYGTTSYANQINNLLKQQAMEAVKKQIDPNYVSPTRTSTGQEIRWKTPLAIGLGIGAADAATRKDYQLPEDLSINIPQTAQAAIDDPNLRFKPIESARLADGGRIGYNDGNLVELRKLLKRKLAAQSGKRSSKQEGGLMDLGGMEKDYRQEGGFVPIGGEEKADDVPARLSKNEFVFTADAVRAAGDGDIDEGAKVMENLMENLEAGGKVSEDSQGLEGAREMFATAQELEKRII